MASLHTDLHSVFDLTVHPGHVDGIDGCVAGPPGSPSDGPGIGVRRQKSINAARLALQ
jgi:hypothetical protein